LAALAPTGRGRYTEGMAPRDAILAVTHRCNARCVMCNVWRSEAVDRIQPEHLGKLPPSLRTVNLTGGEPFLRDDLADFVRAVRRACPRATTTISTNGLRVERIVESLPDLLDADPRLRLAVSLDGLGEVHDRIRGVEGAFAKVLELLDRLGGKSFGGLRLSMTLTAENLGQLPGVADLAEKRGLELGLVAAHEAGTHLGVSEGELSAPADPDPTPLERVIARWLGTIRPKGWLRAHFAAWTWRFLTDTLPSLSCGAGREFFFCQADGEVYSCSVCGQRMGNLVDEPFEALWTGPAADSARQCVETCPRRCWMICTARSVYRRRKLATLAWIARAKLAAHLGRFALPAPRKEASSDARVAD
jgi:Fe-coproporphyrin III synthase